MEEEGKIEQKKSQINLGRKEHGDYDLMKDGKHSETGKLAQQVKVFVAKTDDLSLILCNFVTGGN